MVESQSQSQNKETGGKLYIVGIGPGSVEQMTIKARDVILKADYVLGNGTYLDQIASLLGTQEVIRSYMGKEVDRARKAVELAKIANVAMTISETFLCSGSMKPFFTASLLISRRASVIGMPRGQRSWQV